MFSIEAKELTKKIPLYDAHNTFTKLNNYIMYKIQILKQNITLKHKDKLEAVTVNI